MVLREFRKELLGEKKICSDQGLMELKKQMTSTAG